MKYYLLLITAALSSFGCTTSAITGKKKLLGLIPLPSSSGSIDGADPDKILAYQAFAPHQYAALALFMFGIGMIIIQRRATWAGIVAVSAAVGLSLFAYAVPANGGLITWVLGIVAVVGGAYLIFGLKKKKAK